MPRVEGTERRTVKVALLAPEFPSLRVTSLMESSGRSTIERAPATLLASQVSGSLRCTPKMLVSDPGAVLVTRTLTVACEPAAKVPKLQKRTPPRSAHWP